MKHKPSANTSSCKVISFKNYKGMTSTDAQNSAFNDA